ncbi:hypothetical protein AAMO2058_001730600 [Amorphochlora amoebiformis]
MACQLPLLALLIPLGVEGHEVNREKYVPLLPYKPGQPNGLLITSGLMTNNGLAKRALNAALDCHQSAYGCCVDGITVAKGPGKLGCDIVTPGAPPSCERSKYGCCKDGITPALNFLKRGCTEALWKDIDEAMITHLNRDPEDDQAITVLKPGEIGNEPKKSDAKSSGEKSEGKDTPGKPKADEKEKDTGSSKIDVNAMTIPDELLHNPVEPSLERAVKAARLEAKAAGL